MNPTETETIFEAARLLDSAEKRSHYLNLACGDNRKLREAVDAMLSAHEDAEAYFKIEGFGKATQSEVDGPTQLQIVAEKPGSQIGHYKLLQQIGEGGMGVVFMAEQLEPIRRKVALKIIKLGMDTKSVVARFEAERQALALMDHPNIAKVLDAGATDTGRPYFVMELVKGVPINTYCDKNELSTRDRLELFTQVCQSIQHAHQKGVIHRDIKPSNILVTLHDGNPVPKVIDFGIAKATNQRLTEKTLFTNFAQMIGTPAYMSPEQAEMSGLDIDTRSDVYSLGVLLYELLTGSTPFPEKELLSKGYGEMQRIIVEQEPDRPSLRVSTLVGKQQTIIAKNRAGDQNLLTKQLRGDLDWIVMKSLEKDRTRRYETANGLAEDIRRHLSDEPVTAARPSFLYQLSKTVRRHKPAFAAGLAVLVVLVTTSIAATLAAIRENRAKTLAVEMTERAESMRQTAETLNRFVFDELIALGAPSKSSKKSLTLFEALETLEDRIGDYFAGRPELEIEARMAIGRGYLFRFERNRSQHHLERAFELCREYYGDSSPETLEAGQAYLFGFLGVSDWNSNWGPTAALLYEEARKLYEPDDPRHYLGHCFQAFGTTHGILPRAPREEAIKLMQAALQHHTKIKSNDPLGAALNIELLGLLHQENGDLDLAETYYRRSIEELIEYGGETFPLVLWVRSHIGSLYRDNGEIDKAAKEFETILELGADIFMDSEFLTKASQDLLKIYFYTGEKDKAEALARHVLSEDASEYDVEKFLITQYYDSAQPLSHEEARIERSWERTLKDLQAFSPKKHEHLVQFLIANCYYHLGNNEANYAALKELPLNAVTWRGSRKSEPFLLSLRASNRGVAGKWADAKREIDHALSLAPESVRAHFVGAQVHFNLNDLESWTSHCDKMINTHYIDSSLILRVMLSCLGQGERLPDPLLRQAVDRAENFSTRLREKQSAKDQSTGILLSGLAAWSQGRFEEAIERLAAQPYLDATRPVEDGYDWERHRWRREAVQYLLLANSHAQLQQFEAAKKHFDQAVATLDRITYDWWERFLIKNLRTETEALIVAAK